MGPTIDEFTSDCQLLKVNSRLDTLFGHPVVMDDEHGDFAFNKNFRKAYGLKRQFLHAATVAFEYKGKKRKWSAPLPEDLEATLKSLSLH